MVKNKKTFYIFLLTVTSVCLSAYILIHGFLYAPNDEIAVPSFLKESNAKELARDPSSYPTTLRIPEIGVNAHVQNVGITRAGNMSTPNNFTDVGWFKYGTLPGEPGNAVIAGHVDNGFALPGVFKDLSKLKKGDDIYVDSVGGNTIHFQVTETKIYDYNSPTTDVFTGSEIPTLKLITCTGTWIKELKTHNKRLVVTAIKLDK